MKPAIRTVELRKRYRLGATVQGYSTLRESLTGLIRRVTYDRHPSQAVGGRELWALDGVSIDVMPGEVLGIVGGNGAGKSTLLKILSRITAPTEGRAELAGRVGSLLEVGAGFHPELTGRENVYLNGVILGMSRREVAHRLDEIVAFAEIPEFIDTPVKRYSSGMYTRLAFSVAAHLSTEILLVDEVLAVGDAKFQARCLNRMSEVVGQGRTVLFVSHNMSAIANLCTRGLLLERGRIAAQGDVRSVVEAYLSNVRLSEVAFEGEAVSHAQVQQVREGVEIAVHYQLPVALRLPCLGFVISDAMGNPICGSNAKEDRVERVGPPTSEGTVTALVKSPKLAEGTYRVSLWFGDGEEDFFRKRDCLAFDVVPRGDFKRISPQIAGPVIAHCEWRLD